MTRPPPISTLFPYTTLFRSHGYAVFLASSHADPKRELEVVRSFHERRVDGVIVPSSRVGFQYLRHLSRSEEHTSELQSLTNLVCRLLLEKKNNNSTCLTTVT